MKYLQGKKMLVSGFFSSNKVAKQNRSWRIVLGTLFFQPTKIVLGPHKRLLSTPWYYLSSPTMLRTFRFIHS
jgi:hypothetical protein